MDHPPGPRDPSAEAEGHHHPPAGRFRDLWLPHRGNTLLLPSVGGTIVGAVAFLMAVSLWSLTRPR